MDLEQYLPYKKSSNNVQLLMVIIFKLMLNYFSVRVRFACNGYMYPSTQEEAVLEADILIGRK